jgi:hypothetical protein
MQPNDQLPRLKVRAPWGQSAIVELTNQRVTVGRLPQQNDIALEPDPEYLVTRYSHCEIERDGSTWWLSDGGSVNGTLLVRGSAVYPVRVRTQLCHGDMIRILGARERGSPRYWELLFEDPCRTRPVSEAPEGISIEFDPVQRELFLVMGQVRHRIDLRHQERELIAHMAKRNAEAAGAPVLCTYRELMTAIWGESYRLRDELVHLISGIRRKIAAAAGTELPAIETIRGTGYRLHCGRELRPG